MHLGRQNSLLITTAMSAVITATGLAAQTTPPSALVISDRAIVPNSSEEETDAPLVTSSVPVVTQPSSEALTYGRAMPTLPSTSASPLVSNMEEMQEELGDQSAPALVISSRVPTVPTAASPLVTSPDRYVAPDPEDEVEEEDPDRPTDIPGVGDLPVFAGIGLSSLSPPENAVLTQAVEITAGPVGEEQFIQSTGQTLFGAVMDPAAFDIVEVTVQPSGRTTTVDVSPLTGQFATRVFEDDFGTDGAVTIELTSANSINPEVETESASYTLQAAMPEDGFVQALSRITFGATPQLYARVRAIGFNAYVEEQLNPDTITDAFFEALSTGDLIDPTQTNTGTGMQEAFEYSVARAAYSEKQLQEVMGNFWANHFHASEKGANMHGEIIEDRDFFRENAFGTFQELLVYSAHSPLMSYFLDNTDNRRDNLNENYGREILELHTVGLYEPGTDDVPVYNDDDVIAVSRIFTGWTYEWTNSGASSTETREYVFDFRADRHDFDDKVVPFLGITITGREGDEGEEEGLELLAALSMDPRTQNYVCGKIVQKFVADAPPASFVQNCVTAWEASGGSTEAMLRAILLDPAYINTPSLQRTLSKTPFEFAVSFVRAFDFLPTVSSENAFYNNLREAIADAGYNFTSFPVPTGLPEVGAAWLSSSAMLELYKELQGIASSAQNYGSDLQSQLLDAGLATAEEAAAFMLAIATADRYREEEFAAVVDELKGTDGFFEPATEDETAALRRAIAIITASPSFQLQ